MANMTLASLLLALLPHLFAQVESDFSLGGAVRIGDSSTACSSSIDGAVRFDKSSSKNIEYCDGSSWLEILNVNQSNLNATSTIDFSNGLIQHTTSNCGSYTLNNLKDGKIFTFIVKGTTSATCAFTAYSGSGTGALTVHYPEGHGATTSGEHTVYSILVSGSDAYFAWITTFD